MQWHDYTLAAFMCSMPECRMWSPWFFAGSHSESRALH
jgi:hypothetical protein